MSLYGTRPCITTTSDRFFAAMYSRSLWSYAGVVGGPTISTTNFMFHDCFKIRAASTSTWTFFIGVIFPAYKNRIGSPRSFPPPPNPPRRNKEGGGVGGVGG